MTIPMIPLFVDRQVNQGEENLYRLVDKGDGMYEITFAGTIQTPGTRMNAATFNPMVKTLNELQGLSQAMLDMRKNFIAATIAQTTKNNAALTGVDSNIVIETFLNLDDVTLIHGAYDPITQKVYLP